MGVLQQITDRYNRMARLVPAILVVLPLVALAVTAVPVVVTIWSKVAVLVAAAGLPFVFSQIVRDRGLRIQPELFRSWGGRPSEIMLQWRSAPTRTAVARRHHLIETHLGIALPDEAAEAADPAEADDAYRVATRALRERTRDRSKFPLVFEENITYGFRRNAYACRTPAIVICLLTATATLLLARFSLVPLGWMQQSALVGFDLLTAVGWLTWSRASAVKRAAEAYARQLYASLETFGNDAASAPSQPETT
ncbi:hypothetical protein ACPCHT_38990 [Nucisporomicrobium flavum]|uniref:hypothetical protein n=1 Tax=Nucisporomicrobium flavum TaxID=2785915 RepID=UPI003C2F4682